MKRILFLLFSILGIFSITACGTKEVDGDNKPTPVEPDVPADVEVEAPPVIPDEEITPPAASDVPTFGRTSVVLTAGTNVDAFDWITALEIQVQNGDQITITVEDYGHNFDLKYNNSSNNIISVTASTSTKVVRKNITFTMTDKNYTDEQRYALLDKSIVHIEVQSTATAYTRGTGYFIDFNDHDGKMYIATNHHVVRKMHNNTALIRHGNLKNGDYLEDVCAVLKTKDSIAGENGGGIDFVILEVVGKNTAGRCNTYTNETNFTAMKSKINVLKFAEIDYATYNSRIFSKNNTTYYSKGYPVVDGTTTYTTFKGTANRMGENSPSTDSQAGTTYTYSIVIANGIFGSGASGSPIIDSNMNLIGTYSRGYTVQQIAPDGGAGFVFSSSMSTIISKFCTDVKDSNYSGTLCK